MFEVTILDWLLVGFICTIVWGGSILAILAHIAETRREKDALKRSYESSEQHA